MVCQKVLKLPVCIPNCVLFTSVCLWISFHFLLNFDIMFVVRTHGKCMHVCTPVQCTIRLRATKYGHR